MSKYIICLVIFFYNLSACAQDQKKITILFTNDLHSRVTGFAPESKYSPLTTGDDNTRGGFARIAAIFEKERSDNEAVILTVDAGDFLMGTLFQSLEPETGFQLGLMRKMGYDVIAIGNHEFDYGPSKLASILRSARKNDGMPAVLLSNAEFDRKDAADDDLEQCFADNLVRRTAIIERGGLKFGFFSLMGKVADENAAFAKPVTFAKQLKTARKMVAVLKDEGCDIIVCLSHSGVSKVSDGSWGGEDVELARKVSGIDVIISGHTHTILEKPVMINGIPVVQSGEYGKFAGRLDLTYNGSGVNVDKYSLVPVDDNIKGNTEIQLLIDNQKESIDEKILKPLDMNFTSPVAETDSGLECNEQGDFMNSNLAPLVADAIFRYVNRHSGSGTDIAMVAVGVIRDNLVPGIQTAPDIFRIMSMGEGSDNIPGYPLARVYVTGKELKSVLEILQMAYKSAPENYCYYSGLKIVYDPKGGLFSKIRRIYLEKESGDRVEVDFSKRNKTLYSITANSYMLEFIGIIKKTSFGLINVVPKDEAGNRIRDMKSALIDFDDKLPGIQEGKEWLAITEYLKSMKDLNGNNIPDVDPLYKKPVSSFVNP